MDHFKFSRKPAVPVRTALREGVAPLGAIVLITIGLVAVFALCLHFGADLPPVIPEHLDDGEMVDPNPLRFAFMLTAFVLSFFLARHADRQGERGKVFPAFLTGYAGGTLLWQSVGECSWHFSIVCEDYLMCFPHIEGASALFLVIITVILLNYCRKRHAFGWGVWVFVLSFVGNWFGHFLQIGTFPLVSAWMDEHDWYLLTGGILGPAVALTALALNFFWAQDPKARYCCCLLLYFGIGMIVTGVGGL